MVAVQEVSDQNFSSFIQADTPVLIDFWASWCGPCRLLSPIVDELGMELGEKLRVGKLNVDENPETSQQFGIMGIPTLLIFKQGKFVRQIVGYLPKDQLLARIADLLNY